MGSDSGAFASLEALQARHQELLSSVQSEDQSLGSVATAEIKDFLSRAAATGVRIIDPAERRAVQTCLRFWAAELITRGESDWSLPALAAPQLGPAKPESTATADREASDRELARSRALVRISASARQWRESDRDPGWLLKGDALSEAEQFAQEDDDIHAMVDASRKDETRATRQKIGILTGLVLVLVIWGGIVTWLWVDSVRSEKNLKEALARATEQQDAKDDLLEQLQANFAEQARQTRERQQQIDARQTALQDVAKLIRGLRDAGQINAADIPEILLPLVAALDQATTTPSATALDRFIRGYDETFLQATLVRSKSQTPGTGTIRIPLPQLTASSREVAYDNGKPIDSINFSIVINKERRMPIFSAVNLQRSRVVPVARLADRFRFDPRVPEDVQLAPDSFANTGLDRGRLVSARDIAWGDAFSSDPEAAGRIGYGLTSVMTNVTPRYDTFNRGLWADAERYAREKFSAKSDRVIIFSGPVFAADDATVGSLRVPQRFWKVLIATRPDNPASLFVESYLMAQVDRDGIKIDPNEDFVPASYRVRVSSIERLTGLDFGEVVRAADIASLSATQTAKPATQTGRDLATALGQATGPDEAQRRAAMQQLLDAIRSQEIGEIDPRTLAEAIVTVAKSFGSLSPEAKVNVLTLLSAVPKTRWDMERWIDVKAAARRAVADAAASLGGCSTSSQSCTLIASIKPNLDWPLASGRTVYVQFAGMVREDVKAISDKLKMLDWPVPGEERTPNAAGYNEVRYPDNDDDRRAAELLAADLRALGRSGVRAKKISAKAKILEIWLSI